MTIDLLRALGAAFLVAFTVLAFVWLLTGGRAHRSDRIGSAALAIGFVAGFVVVNGGGWHPETAVNYLPLGAVVVAQLAPRLVARQFPTTNVPLAPRAALVLGALVGAGVFLGLAEPGTAGLLLAAGGAAGGVMAAAGLKAAPAGESAPAVAERGLEQREAPPGQDPRLATWILMAALVVGAMAVR